MPLWDPTHGKARGAYLRVGVNELYVRCDNPLGWSWFVDGTKGGVTGGEVSAKAAAEAALRAMAGTHTARLAAAAG